MFENRVGTLRFAPPYLCFYLTGVQIARVRLCANHYRQHNMTASGRTLHRSRNNRWIAGVVGGLAEYFGMNPNAARLIYVLVSIVSAAFPGILAYIILWILFPMEP